MKYFIPLMIFMVVVISLCSIKYKYIYHQYILNRMLKCTVTLEDRVRGYGYALETHEVRTGDDYLLTVHRIKHRRNSQETNKVPVLLQHGILDSAAAFLASPTGLAYHLAEKGYDVWINNSRGTLYSRKHVTKNPEKDKTYWDFTFHEMGVEDLPAVFKYIRSATGRPRTHYIAMSMGTTMFLVMGSLKPDLLDYVDCVILMAPVACPQHMDMLAPRIKYLIQSYIFYTLKVMGVNRILFQGQLIPAVVHTFCTSQGFTGYMCEKVMRSIVHSKKDLYDFENAKETYQYVPTGAAVKIFKHFMQIAESGRFQQYDYKKLNLKVYGTPDPPQYDLSNLKIRLHLIYGGADNIADKRDVEALISMLPHVEVHAEPFENFTHRDFILAVDLENTLYKTIDDILEHHVRDVPL